MQLLDLLDDPLSPDRVRQLGHHDAAFAGREGLDLSGRTDLERPSTGGICLPDAFQADDPAAGGQVRPRHEAHQRVQTGIGMGEQMSSCRNDLADVVGGHVRGHSHSDPRGAVDQQRRDGGG